MKILRDYAYGWTIGLFFLLSLGIFLVTGWYEYLAEQAAHVQPVDGGEFANLIIRDMMENWQSEFLQLLCQVGLLTWFMFRGSPQSLDTHERMERKIDEIRRAVLRAD